MIHLLNILIVAYLALMVYYWGLAQGFFSALLHLLATVVAAALALALWQSVALDLLMGVIPHFAWGVGLLLPFIVILPVVRLAIDKLVPGNVPLGQLVNALAGGFCGLLSGILTSGIILIGLGFLPLQADILGYQPYAVAENGQLQPGPGKLWVGVDRMAAGWLSGMSSGTWRTGQSIRQVHGDLLQQSTLIRLRMDERASSVAEPAAVSVKSCLTHGQAVPGLTDEQLKTLDTQGLPVSNRYQLLFIDTRWQEAGTNATFIDKVLRLPPTQVRLLTRPAQGDGWPMQTSYAPRAVSESDSIQTERLFRPFSSDRNLARIDAPPGQLGFVFVIPADEVPSRLLVRNLPLDIPAVRPADDSEFLAILGKSEGTSLFAPPPPSPSPSSPSSASPSSPASSGGVTPDAQSTAGAVAVQITDALPNMFSVNSAGSLRIQGNAVTGGSSKVPPGSTMIAQDSRVTRLSVPGTQACIRLQIVGRQAQSIFGKSRDAARMLEAIYLADSRGQDRLLPVGYAWVQSSGEQMIAYDPDQPIQSAKLLPIIQMGQGDQLYVYFLVPKGVKITAYHLGNSHKQELNISIPR